METKTSTVATGPIGALNSGLAIPKLILGFSVMVIVTVDVGDVTGIEQPLHSCRRCGSCIVAEMYRATSKIDSSEVFEFLTDEAFIAERNRGWRALSSKKS